MSTSYRLLQVNSQGMASSFGFSPYLDWRRYLMPVFLIRNGSGVSLAHGGTTGGQHGVDAYNANYTTINGDVKVPAPADLTAVQWVVAGASGNPGEDLTGESMTYFYDGNATGYQSQGGLTNLSALDNATKTGTFKLTNNNCNLGLSFTDHANPARNLRVFQDRYKFDTTIDGVTYPGWSNGGEFNPHWLAEVRRFQRIRFMDDTPTNGSPMTSYSQWADDTCVFGDNGNGHVNFYGDSLPKWGMPIAKMCRVAAQTGTDIWVCVPHLLGTTDSDASITALATALKNNLPAGRRVLVEWSNEVWNDFPQGAYAAGQAAGKGLQAGFAMEYAGYRAAQVMKIFRDVFNDRTRWGGIVATQTVNIAQTNSFITGFNKWKADTGSSLVLADLFEELAVTGYFGDIIGGFQIASFTAGNPTVITLTSDQSGNPEFAVGQQVVLGFTGSNGTAFQAFATTDGNFNGPTRYATISAISGATVTLNVNTTGLAFTQLGTGNGSYLAAAGRWKLMDQSESLHNSNAATYPTKYTYFNQQMASLCLTGACSFGLTMHPNYVVDYMDQKNGGTGLVDPSNSYWGKQQAIANANGLALSWYEGGCHYLGSTLVAGNPQDNPNGTRFIEFQVRGLGHSAELAEVYAQSYRRFIAMGGQYPSKYTGWGYTSRSGTWGGVRFWPMQNTPNGDVDNPVWQAVSRATQNIQRFKLT